MAISLACTSFRLRIASGVPVEEIEAFARLVGTTKRSFFRLGYGFTCSRNGAAQMHAATVHSRGDRRLAV